MHRESAAYADYVVAIHESGDPATKVDLLLMGDGYTDEEQHTFIETATELTEILFATYPFSKRKDDFNVWAVVPPARQSGVGFPDRGQLRCLSLRAVRADQ